MRPSCKILHIGPFNSSKCSLIMPDEVREHLVSASDVTPMDCWLNVWCIWYTYLETLHDCRSCCRIGWIVQDFRETCVLRSLMFHLETKAVTPPPLTKEESRSVYKCDGERLSESTKCWNFKNVWEILSKNPFRFTAPWRCCFSSVHLTYFL